MKSLITGLKFVISGVETKRRTLCRVFASNSTTCSCLPKKSMYTNEIRSLANQIHEKIVRWRRYLHQNPEISLQEYETTALDKARLDDIGRPNSATPATGLVSTHTGVQTSI